MLVISQKIILGGQGKQKMNTFCLFYETILYGQWYSNNYKSINFVVCSNPHSKQILRMVPESFPSIFHRLRTGPSTGESISPHQTLKLQQTCEARERTTSKFCCSQ